MEKLIPLILFGSGFGHLTLVLRSGLSVSIVKLKDILWRDRTGTSLGGLIGIGNKNKRQVTYGAETLVLAVFTLLAYYILTAIEAPFMIGSISIYTVIPFVLFFVYYIAKIVVIAKK